MDERTTFSYWLIVLGIVLAFMAVCFILSLIWWLVILKILCWALPAIGITTIFGWTISFSWPLVFICSIASSVLSGIFKSVTTVKKD